MKSKLNWNWYSIIANRKNYLVCSWIVLLDTMLWTSLVQWRVAVRRSSRKRVETSRQRRWICQSVSQALATVFREAWAARRHWSAKNRIEKAQTVHSKEDNRREILNEYPTQTHKQTNTHTHTHTSVIWFVEWKKTPKYIYETYFPTRFEQLFSKHVEFRTIKVTLFAIDVERNIVPSIGFNQLSVNNCTRRHNTSVWSQQPTSINVGESRQNTFAKKRIIKNFGNQNICRFW